MATETEEVLRETIEGVGENVQQLMREIDDAMPEVPDGPVRELLVRVRHRLANIGQALLPGVLVLLSACTSPLAGPTPPTRLPLEDGIRHVVCTLDVQLGGETIPPGPEWYCIVDTTAARQRWQVSRPDTYAIEFDLTDAGPAGARLTYNAWNDGAWQDLDGNITVEAKAVRIEAQAGGRDVRALISVP